MSNGISYSIGCNRVTYDFSKSSYLDTTGNSLGYTIGVLNQFGNAAYTATCPLGLLYGFHNIESDPIGFTNNLITGTGQWPYAVSTNTYTVPSGVFVSCVSQEYVDGLAEDYAEEQIDCTGTLYPLLTFFDSEIYAMDNIEDYGVGDITILTEGYGWEGSGTFYG